MANDTTPVSIATDDGVTLSGERLPAADAVAAAVICHPHPLYGGNMYNNVVSELFHALGRAGVDCLRFDFRGVGASGGSHGEGEAERTDVVAAIGAQAEAVPDRPIILAGYSFGADVALTVAHDRLAAWLVVAPPLRLFDLDRMVAGPDGREVLILSGTADEFRPADQATETTAAWTNTTVTPIQGTNHFFATGLDEVATAARELVGRLTAP